MTKIREATVEDASAISELVTECTRNHIAPTLSAYGAKRLMDAMSADLQRERIAGEYKFFVAIDGNRMIGVAAINPPDHLYYLFVATNRQGQGIGKQLFDRICEHFSQTPDLKTISVNSSLNSVPFYQRLGFTETGPIKNDDEIVFQPMQFILASSSTS